MCFDLRTPVLQSKTTPWDFEFESLTLCQYYYFKTSPEVLLYRLVIQLFYKKYI
jgi:hypothetical protein